MKYFILTALLIFLASCSVEDAVTGDLDENINDADSSDTGNTGNTADTGNTGNTGNSGDTADTGNTGDTGNSGDTADSGNTGDTGDTGDSGDTVDHGDNTPDTETQTVRMISSGSAHVCAVKDSGHLYCWGQGNRGQLGNNQTPGGDNPNTKPVQVGIDAWTSVCSMVDSTCGIKKNKEAFCWGHNADGQIANGLDGYTFQATGTPSPILLGADDNQYDPMFCGGTTIIAVTETELWGWGSNRMGTLANGQIGYDASYPGGSATAYVPRLLNGNAEDWSVFEKIALSGAHACGISAGSDLYCWGSYDMAQFGDGRKGDGFDKYSFRSQAKYSEYLKPVKVGDSKWVDIAALNQNSCGIKDDGTLWCWGIAEWGVLGIGDVFETYTADTPEDSVTYTASFQALIDSGDCFAQFYSKDTAASQNRRYPPGCTSPVQVGTASNWISVSGSTNHVCAINSDDELYCWGENEYGQIGNGEAGDVYSTLPSNYDLQTTPFKVEGSFIAVSTGYNFTCAISKEKSVYCWGYSGLGISGYVGNKDNPQTTPMKITF